MKNPFDSENPESFSQRAIFEALQKNAKYYVGFEEKVVEYLCRVTVPGLTRDLVDTLDELGFEIRKKE